MTQRVRVRSGRRLGAEAPARPRRRRHTRCQLGRGRRRRRRCRKVAARGEGSRPPAGAATASGWRAGSRACRPDPAVVEQSRCQGWHLLSLATNTRAHAHANARARARARKRTHTHPTAQVEDAMSRVRQKTGDKNGQVGRCQPEPGTLESSRREAGGWRREGGRFKLRPRARHHRHMHRRRRPAGASAVPVPRGRAPSGRALTRLRRCVRVRHGAFAPTDPNHLGRGLGSGGGLLPPRGAQRVRLRLPVRRGRAPNIRRRGRKGAIPCILKTRAVDARPKRGSRAREFAGSPAVGLQ